MSKIILGSALERMAAGRDCEIADHSPATDDSKAANTKPPRSPCALYTQYFTQVRQHVPRGFIWIMAVVLLTLTIFPRDLLFDISRIAVNTAAHSAALTMHGGDAGCELRLLPSEAAAIAGAPKRVAVCTIVRDEARYVREWVAFHRAQGVYHIDMWDDGSTDAVDLQIALRDHLDAGTVTLRRIANVRAFVVELRALAVARRRVAPGSCAPSDTDLDHLTELADECVSTRNITSHVPCQFFGMRACGALAKLRGDAFLGIFDVDEFMWAPPPGSPLTGSGPSVTKENAPMLPGGGGGIPFALMHYSSNPIWTSFTLNGAMYGTSGYNSSAWEGNVLDTHVRRAPYSASGASIPGPWLGYWPAACPRQQCHTAAVQKSFLRVTGGMPVDGIAIHTSFHLGPIRLIWTLAEGARLRHNHYSYMSTEEVLAKKVKRNRNPPDSPAAWVAGNVERTDEYFNLVEDPAAAAFAPLLRYCMAPGNAFTPACGGAAVAVPDERGAYVTA